MRIFISIVVSKALFTATLSVFRPSKEWCKLMQERVTPKAKRQG